MVVFLIKLVKFFPLNTSPEKMNKPKVEKKKTSVQFP